MIAFATNIRADALILTIETPSINWARLQKTNLEKERKNAKVKTNLLTESANKSRNTFTGAVLVAACLIGVDTQGTVLNAVLTKTATFALYNRKVPYTSELRKINICTVLWHLSPVKPGKEIKPQVSFSSNAFIIN